jgi:hypothetical protein
MSKIAKAQSIVGNMISAARSLAAELLDWADKIVKPLDLCGWIYAAIEYARENELISIIGVLFS